jgi:hypothetical protein
LASHENCMTDIMQEYCKPACTEQHHFEVLIQSGIVSIPKVESFYDLHALDIQENPVDFKQFRGKVVLVTNVASYCGEYIFCCHPYDARFVTEIGKIWLISLCISLLQATQRSTTSK